MKFTLFLLFLLPLTVQAQSDFDCTFQPANARSIYQTRHVTTDTVKLTVEPRSDSSEAQVRCIVEKRSTSLKILSLEDISKPVYLYEGQIRFVGVTNDGSGCAVYEGANRETIFLNPVMGFVIIKVVSNCEDPAKVAKDAAPKCDTVWHYFGSAWKGFRP